MTSRVQLPRLLSCFQDLLRGACERPWLVRVATTNTVAFRIIFFDELVIRCSLRLAG